jgi:hypothetical protein
MFFNNLDASHTAPVERMAVIKEYRPIKLPARYRTVPMPQPPDPVPIACRANQKILSIPSAKNISLSRRPKSPAYPRPSRPF